jgi:hypothetical protein
MIREFFAPRVYLFTLLVFGLLWWALWRYLEANRKERRTMWRTWRVPLFAALGAVAITSGFLLFINVFN